MSIKLDTYNTSDNKVTKSQFNYEVIEDINIGLLHQVVKSNRTNFRNNTASVKTRSQVSELEQSRGPKKAQVELGRVHYVHRNLLVEVLRMVQEEEFTLIEPLKK